MEQILNMKTINQSWLSRYIYNRLSQIDFINDTEAYTSFKEWLSSKYWLWLLDKFVVCVNQYGSIKHYWETTLLDEVHRIRMTKF